MRRPEGAGGAKRGPTRKRRQVRTAFYGFWSAYGAFVVAAGVFDVEPWRTHLSDVQYIAVVARKSGVD